jgi:formylglycine-generating enzyme required for sulfatase activity
MKKLLPLLVSLVLVLSACGLPGAQAEPTAVVLPTAVPTEAVSSNAPGQAAGGNAGDKSTSAADGMVQVYVPGGKFQMGGVDADAQDDEKPAHFVTVGPFWMDIHEVTTAMYQLCVAAGTCNPPREFKSEGRESYFGNKDFADYPVVFVSWEDAKNYCAWAGRELPTEAQWEYAARGSADFRRFPWGDQSPTNNLANYDFTVRDTTRVGSFPNGASSFGILDMAGNVWEWVADFYDPQYYAQAPADNPTGPNAAGPNGPRRVIRGGSWADNFKDLRVSNRGFALAPDLTADSKSEAYMGEGNSRIGFRCAAPGK